MFQFSLLKFFNILHSMWKKTFKTIHPLSCFVGHPVLYVKESKFHFKLKYYMFQSYLPLLKSRRSNVFKVSGISSKDFFRFLYVYKCRLLLKLNKLQSF